MCMYVGGCECVSVYVCVTRVVIMVAVFHCRSHCMTYVYPWCRFKEDLYNTWQRGGELNLHGLDVEEWYANIQTRAQAGDVLALSILEGTAPFPKVPTNAAEFRKLVGRGRWVVPKGTSAALEGASESRVVLRRISEREE